MDVSATCPLVVKDRNLDIAVPRFIKRVMLAILHTAWLNQIQIKNFATQQEEQQKSNCFMRCQQTLFFFSDLAAFAEIPAEVEGAMLHGHVMLALPLNSRRRSMNFTPCFLHVLKLGPCFFSNAHSVR
jgi:hypothetical protein